MKRGDIWTASGAKDYAGKPRPVTIVQDEFFDSTDSITVCPITSDQTEIPLFRLGLEPSDDNGLRIPCRIMVDKVTTISKSKLGVRIGRLDDEDVVRLNRAILVFLGLGARPKARGGTRKAS